MQGYYPNNSYSNSVMTVFVDGEAGANAYPVAAGYTVMLIDFNSGKFWIKGTDPNGVPQRMRTFDFKEKIVQPGQEQAHAQHGRRIFRTGRTGDQGQVPSSSFPVYRAQCRGGCILLQMRRKGLPYV